MNDAPYTLESLADMLEQHFSETLEVQKIIANRIETSRTSEATVFLSKKKQLYVYISAQSSMVRSDVQKMIARMGLKADEYLPPKNQPDYFEQFGATKFRQVFPGRSSYTADDIRFYKTLAPYNPALVKISEVKTGEIYEWNSDASSGWRVATKFAYRRITASS
ncbi:hypothetical protein FJZ39_01580 [Candidatus Saccharibacteria bacterium]|nr:hypothetical protein [Candidatus Saccharibacteria bacterium]